MTVHVVNFSFLFYLDLSREKSETQI